ncbi:MAG: putative membrane protein YecN with MAPEG domain [Arenicella sp.]|jgi:uncharacterized membrane protein YecN with MAPEG domain
MVVVTPLFAAIFGLMYMALSLNVLRHRRGVEVSLDARESPKLERAIRAHGNFIEYVPFALLLMWFIETLTLSSNVVFWLGSILLIARVSHAFGMYYPKQLLILRQAGTLATLGVIIKASISIFQYYMPLSI